MRAVNLIPDDARRGGGAGAAGRSDGAAFVLLGGLTVMVVLVGLWALTGRTLNQHRAELSALHTQISAAQARTAANRPSDPAGAQLDQQRLEAVRALAVARTDWAKTLDAVARTLPSNTHLTTLNASTTPDSGSAGGAGSSAALASSTSGPSLQVAGCTTTQKAVAQLMPRMRIIPGVQHVSLVSATAADPHSATGSSDGCKGVDFSMVVFLEPKVAPAPATPTPGAPATTPPATPATTPPATTGTGQ